MWRLCGQQRKITGLHQIKKIIKFQTFTAVSGGHCNGSLAHLPATGINCLKTLWKTIGGLTAAISDRISLTWWNRLTIGGDSVRIDGTDGARRIHWSQTAAPKWKRAQENTSLSALFQFQMSGHQSWRWKRSFWGLPGSPSDDSTTTAVFPGQF